MVPDGQRATHLSQVAIGTLFRVTDDGPPAKSQRYWLLRHRRIRLRGSRLLKAFFSRSLAEVRMAPARLAPALRPSKSQSIARWTVAGQAVSID